MLMLPRSVLTRMWSPSCVGTEPVKSEVRRLSGWVAFGSIGLRRAEALAAMSNTEARDVASNPLKGFRKSRRVIRAVKLPRIATYLEFFARANIANGRGTLQANVRVGIFLHSLAQHVCRVAIGIHLALGSHIPQRIDGLDPDTGILVLHKS